MQALQQNLMQPRPHAGFLPVAQTPPATHAAPAAHLGRQHLPRQAGAQHEQNAGQRRPIVDRRPSALRAGPRRRQERGHLRPEIVGKQSASHAPPTHHPPLRAVLLGALNFFSRSRRRSPQTAFASQPIDLDLIPPGTLRKRPVASEVLGRDDGVSGTRSGHAASMICRRRTILEKAWIDRTSSRLGPSCCGLGHSSDIEHRPHCQHGHRSFALGAKPRYTGCNRYGAAKMGNDQSQR